MFKITEKLQQTAARLLESGEVEQVLGFTKGKDSYQSLPYIATTSEEAKNLIFDLFSEKALSKYLVQDSFQDKKTAIVVKGCDYRGIKLMLEESRISRDQIYLMGVECPGMIRKDRLKKEVGEELYKVQFEFDQDQIEATDNDGKRIILYEDVLSPFCLNCKYSTPPEAEVDLLLTGPALPKVRQDKKWTHQESFTEINEIENMSEEEKFEYWKQQLNRCKRCYACRNACPVCTCRKCLFERKNPDYLDAAKDQLAQHQFYHIIRAFHVSDRCVGCGECSRVCPEGIPLHLLNQKLRRDLEEFYGSYEVGIDELPTPLSHATADEPDFYGKGAK